MSFGIVDHSDLTVGRRRASAGGNHQLARLANPMAAGTSTIRMSVASMMTATARLKPNCLSSNTSATRKLPNTAAMIAAPAVIWRAVRSRPTATA